METTTDKWGPSIIFFSSSFTLYLFNNAPLFSPCPVPLSASSMLLRSAPPPPLAPCPAPPPAHGPRLRRWSSAAPAKGAVLGHTHRRAEPELIWAGRAHWSEAEPKLTRPATPFFHPSAGRCVRVPPASAPSSPSLSADTCWRLARPFPRAPHALVPAGRLPPSFFRGQVQHESEGDIP